MASDEVPASEGFEAGMAVARALGMLEWTARRRRIARLGLEVSSVLVVAFLAVNGHPYQAPEPLWTTVDLPTASDDSDNGWAVVTGDYEAEIPEDLQPLLGLAEHEGERFWQRVEPRAERLHEFMAGKAGREAIERVDEARRRSVFVDDCEPNEICKVVPWRKLHRVASLRSLELALAGDEAESCRLLRDLIRMDLAHLESARSLIGFMVALGNLQEALDRADLIALRLGSRARDVEVNAASSELAQAVRSVDVEAVDLRNVVIGEYLSQVEMLEALARAEPDMLERIGVARGVSWLYSEALTLRGVNERFERRHRLALEHDMIGALGGGERSPKQSFGWWFRNAVGNTFLDLATVNPERWAGSIAEDLAAIDRTRTRALERPALR